MSITQVSTVVIEDGSITKAKLDLSSGTSTAGQVLAIDGTDNFYFTDRFVAEEVDDRVAALINAGTHSNITIVYDDVANTLSFSATGAVTSVNGQTGIVVLDTDDISEGATNLYYTTSRVLGEFSASGDLSYDSANGIFSVNTYKSTDFDTDFAAKTTDDLSEGVLNLYYTDQRVWDSLTVIDAGGDGSFTFDANTGSLTYTGPSAAEVYAHFSAGTGVSITNGQISIGQAVATTSNVTFNDMIVSGNLTVNGTTTTVNTETLDVADNIITLNSDWDANTAPTQDAGIEINRGTETNASWTWNETGDFWTPSHKIDMGGLTVTNLGTPILNSDAATKEYVDSVSSNVGSLTSDDITEGLLNLYFTEERAQDAIGNLIVGGTNITVDYDDANNTMTITANGLTGSTTDDLTEGTTNLYFTEERVDDRIASLLVAGLNTTITYDDANNTITIDTDATGGYDLSNNTTDDLAEGLLNLYYTDTRVRDAISVSGDLSYDSANGIISFAERTDSEVRSLFSATGDISYDEPNGIFSVTTYKSTDFDTDFALKNTDDLTEGTTNLYYTDTRARASITIVDYSNLVTYDTANGIVTVNQLDANVIYALFTAENGITYNNTNGTFGLDSTYSPTFADMILTGNLTVQGTTTTVDTEQLLVADNIITLNSDVTGTPTENAGIEVERGTSNNVGIRWNETTDTWQFSNDGVTYTNIGSASVFTGNTDGVAEGSTNLYFTDERAQDAIANIMIGGNNITFTYDDANNIMTIDNDISSTTDLPEGTNLYYTDARWDAKMALADTDDLSEGVTNLYYTQTRADARVDVLRTELSGDGTGAVHFNNLTNVPIVTSQTFTGNGTQTQFTLQDDPGSPDALIVTLNGVTQTPGADYNVSGTTLTFTSALPNGQVALVRFVGYQIAGSTPTGALPLAGGTMSGSILVGADNTYDLGTATNQWRAVYGHTIEATYADLAERYEIDSDFELGSVVVFGGDKEITLCKKSADVSVAGVISTDPAFKMNTQAGDDTTHPYVALRGRVPCKVVGPVHKGDLLVTSSIFGYAKSVGKTDMGLAVFAKSITEDLSDGPKTIEVVII